MSHDPVPVHHRELHPELFADLIGEPLHVVSRSLADAVTCNQRQARIVHTVVFIQRRQVDHFPLLNLPPPCAQFNVHQ